MKSLCSVVCVLFLLVAGMAYADIYGSDNLWTGENRFENNVTLGSSSADTITKNGTLTTGSISATEIANVTRSFSLPLAGAAVDGGNDVDDASAPDITTCDNVPCIVWADSSETGAIQYTFRLPSDFVSGLTIYAMISSNAASGSGQKLDWAIWENGDLTIDAAAIAQAEVEATSATLDASCEVLKLEADETAEAAFTAGRFYTLEFFNASTDDDDIELKGLELEYTATQ